MPPNAERSRTNETFIHKLEQKESYASLVRVAMSYGSTDEEIVRCLEHLAETPGFRTLFSPLESINARQIRDRKRYIQNEHGQTYAEFLDAYSSDELEASLRPVITAFMLDQKPLVASWMKFEQTGPLVHGILRQYRDRNEPFDRNVVYYALKTIIPDNEYLQGPQAKNSFSRRLAKIQPQSYEAVMAELEAIWPEEVLLAAGVEASEWYDFVEKTKNETRARYPVWETPAIRSIIEAGIAAGKYPSTILLEVIQQQPHLKNSTYKDAMFWTITKRCERARNNGADEGK